MTAPTTPRDPFTDEDVRKALDAFYEEGSDEACMAAALLAGTERLRAQTQARAERIAALEAEVEHINEIAHQRALTIDSQDRSIEKYINRAEAAESSLATVLAREAETHKRHDAKVEGLEKANAWRPLSEIGDYAYVTPVLVNAPEAHRGHDSMEVCVVCPLDDGTLSFWTNGGPNGGLDFDIDPPPTHFRPLPPALAALPEAKPAVREGE